MFKALGLVPNTNLKYISIYNTFTSKKYIYSKKLFCSLYSSTIKIFYVIRIKNLKLLAIPITYVLRSKFDLILSHVCVYMMYKYLWLLQLKKKE